MAGDATQQANVLCKKCGSKVVNFVKCKPCQHQFHPSCAKILNATFHDNKSITCCEKHEIFEDADDGKTSDDEINWENISPELNYDIPDDKRAFHNF
ncbi:hypothetical protein TcasGA2_TC016410 [Tribolium castaneum]|uniref:Uncharacterized protein n=1 Tax=Tribolium castaneum TaxID=7070 RepID=D7EIX7_TRICA|nr:hypothetical protein TcasGA2_TC016410 [Tribolium castaneum]